jgi:hypothetical protein
VSEGTGNGSASASAKLSERFPQSSVLTDLVGQLKDRVSGLKSPEMPGDMVQTLTAGLNLQLPDTSTWHTAIPADAKSLVSNFPDAATLAKPITDPIGKVSNVFSFDFGKFQKSLSATKEVPAAPAAVASMIAALATPVEEAAKLLSDPQLVRFLETLSGLTGAPALKDVPRITEQTAAEVKNVLHDKIEAVVLAFITLVSAHSSQELLGARVAGVTGTFSLSDSQKRLQAVLDQYGHSPTLAAMVANTDAGDPTAIAALSDKVNAVNDAFTTYSGRLVRDLALTETGFAVLGASDLQPAWQQMQAAISQVDWSAANTLANLINSEALKIKEKLVIDSGLSIDQYQEAVRTAVGQMETLIGKFDPSQIVQAIQGFFKVVVSPLEKLEDFKAQVETIVRGALGGIRDAVQSIDLKPLKNTVQQALATLEDALKKVAAVLSDVRNAIQSAMNTVKAALDEVKSFVLDPETGLKKKIEDVFHTVEGVLDSLKIEDVVNEVKSLLQPVNDALAKIEFQPIFDAVLKAIGAITTVLKTVGPLLVTDALKQKLADAAAFLNQIDFGKIGDTLTGAFQEILATVDQDALGAFQAEYEQVVSGLKNFDPEPSLKELQKEVFDPLLEELKKVHPSDLLQPVKQAFQSAHEALAKFDPVETFSFITKFFQELLAKIDEISPAKLLEPVEKMLDDLRNQINSVLHLDVIASAFQKFKAWMQPAINDLDIFGPILDGLAGGQAQIIAIITNFDGSIFQKVIANLLQGALRPLGAFVNTSGLASALSAIVAEPGQPGSRLAEMQNALADCSAQLGSLDAQSALAALRGPYSEVTAALGARTGAPLPVALTASITGLDPMPVLAPLLPKIDRVKAAVQAKATTFGATTAPLAAIFQGLENGVNLLHTLLSPLGVVRDALLAPIQGLFPGQKFSGPKDVLLHFLNRFNLSELRPVLQPLFDTIHAKLKALVDDAVLNPLAEVVHTLTAATDVLNIRSLVDAVTSVFTDVENVIRSLDPTPLIQEIGDEYKQIVAMLDQVDPSQFIQEITTLYEEDIVGVIQQISPEALLLPPLRELFQKIVAALGAFDLEAIFKPVFDRLKNLDAELGGGLHDVEGAWSQMLGVLSSSTGEASGSVSVGAA